MKPQNQNERLGNKTSNTKMQHEIRNKMQSHHLTLPLLQKRLYRTNIVCHTASTLQECTYPYKHIYIEYARFTINIWTVLYLFFLLQYVWMYYAFGHKKLLSYFQIFYDLLLLFSLSFVFSTKYYYVILHMKGTYHFKTKASV